MSKFKTYTLQVGGKAKERLLILNSVCNPFTCELLDELSAAIAGKKALDVGCGIGIVSYELSTRLGERGEVLGVDSSEEQLRIARAFIGEKHCPNVAFKVLSAVELTALERKFDLIYCRFLLCHVTEPEIILQQMLDCLGPEGILIIEEPTGYEPMFSCPPSPAFDCCKDIHLRQGKVFNTDFHIGRSLYKWLLEHKLKIIHDRLVQPLLKTEYEKRQLWLALQELSKELVKAGLITGAAINHAIDEVKAYAQDTRYQAAYVQYRQLAATRKA